MTETHQKLEKEKEELLNSLTQIMKDSSEKLPIIKELSRAIANITEQINKITTPQVPSPVTPVTPALPEEKVVAERKKEEIKQIKKEKMEMQPKEIQEKAETAKWKMEDIIKVIKLDLSTIEY
jgi:uncharacterized protein with von Willebrand factor type A (vWA) domain